MKNFYTTHSSQHYITLILLLFCNFHFAQTTYTVTNIDDEGAGTLREAINLANQSNSRDSIHFAIIGSGPHIIYLESSLPNIVYPIVLDATSQTNYLYKFPQIIIDGKENEIIVFTLNGESAGSVIKGFSIQGLGLLNAEGLPKPYSIGSYNSGTAILAVETGDHIFQENLFGNTMENDTIYSLRYGIILENSSNNLIGGENMGNVISGSEVTGITIVGLKSTNNLIWGNFIGTNPAGTAAKPNRYGITIGEKSRYNTIGGSNVKDRNVIAGNSYYGALVGGSRNKVIGNFVGLDATGDALGNRTAGINIRYATSIENATPIENTIGGFGPGERNIISANGVNNVLIAYASNNEILGNYIGTDTLGTKELFYAEGIRQSFGVRIDQAENNHVSGNLISGNVIGISISTESRNNRIRGNLIGTNALATQALPNETGVRIANTSFENTIGGLEPGDANTLAYNTFSGILMKKYDILTTPGSYNNKFSGNRIFANGALGIDLFPDGITENDSDDSDTGQNNLQNFPEIKNPVSLDGNILKLEYRVPSSPQYSVYPITVEFFKSDGNRQGMEYLGSDIYRENDISKGRKGKSISLELLTGNSLNGGDKVLGTATDAEGNTSEFGAEVDVTGGCTESIWYADKDRDDLGDPNDTKSSCTQPEGYVSNSDDCDDTNFDVGAGSLWYADGDGDTFGNPNVSKTACNKPEGFVANSEDCDDNDPTINPAATDVCSDCDLTNDVGCEVGCLGTDVLYIAEGCTTGSTVNWVITNPGNCPVDVRWELRKREDSGNLTVPPGDTYFTSGTASKGSTQVTIYWKNTSGSETKTNANASGITCPSSSAIMGDEIGDTDPAVKVYPNPVTSEGIWLHFAERNKKAQFKVVAYDLSGRKMAETVVSVDTSPTDILWEEDHSRWIEGIYVLNISSGNEIYQIKIIK